MAGGQALRLRQVDLSRGSVTQVIENGRARGANTVANADNFIRQRGVAVPNVQLG